MHGLGGLRLLGLAIAAVVGAVCTAPANAATNGTLVAQVVAPAATTGNSVAFDGQYLYYTNQGELHEVAPGVAFPIIHSVTPSGVPGPDIIVHPLVGVVTNIQVLSYDATRDQFWAVADDLDNLGRIIYRIDKAGNTQLQFVIPESELVGECDNGSPTPPGAPGICNTNVDGIAYESRDDTIWYSPDGSQRIYHFDATGAPCDVLGVTDLGLLPAGAPCGVLLGYYDVNEPGQEMQPYCAENYSSGIAVGDEEKDATSSNGKTSPVMYDFAGPCDTWFRYHASDVNKPVRQAEYPTYPFNPVLGNDAEDDECDSDTFSQNVVWVRSFNEGVLRAYVASACITGGGTRIVQTPRMTGGGGLPTVDSLGVSHGQDAHVGVLIHCNSLDQPNQLEINWGSGNHFHMTELQTSTCSSSNPLTLVNNAVDGTGVGRCNGKTVNATVRFRFVDNGEPGSTDYGEVHVSSADANCNVDAMGTLLTGPLLGEGNYQFHQAS